MCLAKTYRQYYVAIATICLAFLTMGGVVTSILYKRGRVEEEKYDILMYETTITTRIVWA